MRSRSNILIIGGTGFIGSYITKALSDRGEVLTVVHRRSVLKPERLTDIETAVMAIQPDPAIFGPILQLLDKLPRIKKIVYLSTAQLYQDSPRKQTETASLVPLSEYEKRKYYEEMLLGQFGEKRKIALCIARLSNVYGDIKNRGIVGLLIRQLLYKTELTINGDEKQKKDFIFVEDVAELISYLVMRKQTAGCEVFNISSGYGGSINEVIKILQKLSGKKITFKRAPFPPLEKKSNIVDNTKIIKSAKYKIRYDLINGLKKALDNYVKSV